MGTTITSIVDVLEDIMDFVTGNSWLAGLLGISVALGVIGSIISFFRR